ncbi:LysE family translocator [Flavimaricola marinus]|uniref:Cysteine/O-acetylserine efflux protein n=1 Tax=Flavimaricola marinus TaxID=1819565 RepID=A0A238LDL3_9RHOB|nr:LysE family translocator [Flavimaricola marinus]SMY07701.1 Cysteine/O-acetylserine efflux protein [Flavimaricola marinus]
MTIDLFLALLGFAFVSSITPGPNNLMLMASGANFGMRRTIPHMLGISLGHAFMVTMVGIGLGQIFALYPMAKAVMTGLSVLYLLYLAWKIANAAPPKSKETTGSPLTFLQAAAFQWVNPKAWYMALTAVSAYTPDGSGLWGALSVAGIFACTNLPSITVWTGLGTQLRRFLTNPARLRLFNWTMAGLLVLTLIPILFE